MTPKEIIAGLESLAEDRKSFFDCDDAENRQFHDDYNALLYAILELEFRKPQYVEWLYQKTNDANSQVGRCPECNELIQESMKYCPYCGQALLWP